jgi:putative ABC transport system permease protein
MRWIQQVFGRRAYERKLASELTFHLEQQIKDNLAAGMSPEQARSEAVREFGGLEQVKEECRDQRSWVWLEQCLKDTAFSVRSLCRARGFTLTVLAMLVLGIGVAALVFNLIACVVLFAQPYPHPEELFLIGFKDKHSASNPYRFSIHLQAYEEQTQAFSAFAAVTRDVANVVVDGEPLLVSTIGASVDCFRTLAIKPVLGRGFLPEEYRAGADNVVIVTDLFWRQHLHAAPDALGRQLLVNQQPCTVVGVLAVAQSFPPTFEGDVYRPMVLATDPANPLGSVVFVIGRMRPGVPPEQARAALATVKLPTLPPSLMAYITDQEVTLIRPMDLARPEAHWLIAIAAALLYAIACFNTMNLMLVRLLGRRRELSIRLALGGTRWQIMRLLIIESAGLAMAACLIVTLASRWVFPPVAALITGSEAVKYVSFWNPVSLRCIFLLSSLASIAVVVVPVWRLAKSEINLGLKDGGPRAGESRGVQRIQASLVVLQAALAVMLLAGTGLMVRSFEKLSRVDLGFDPVGKVKVTVTFPQGYNPAPEVRLQLFARLQQRLSALPSVRDVSFGQDSLLTGEFSGGEQLLMPDGTYRFAACSFVGSKFLETAGMVMKKGRWLSGRQGEFEVVINETFAKARFGDEDPIGKPFKLLGWGDTVLSVVGVVGNIRDSVRSVPGMRFYCPIWAYPQAISSLLLRLDRDPGKTFAGLVRHAIYDLDPKLIVSQVSSINEIVGNGMWAERYAFKILRGLSAIAFGLAIVGLFSVLTYTIHCRMREFGVRLALGAQPADLRRLVLKRGLTTAAIGVVVGTAGALGLTRFMQSLLFETTPYDPLVYLAVGIVLLASAAAACWHPARRAAQVDITRLLRAE